MADKLKLPAECDALSKRDRQAAAMAMSYAQQDGAFSVLFDFTSKRGLKVSLYREQPKPLWQRSELAQDNSGDDDKENVSEHVPAPAVAPAAACDDTRSTQTRSAPPPPPRQQGDFKVVSYKKTSAKGTGPPRKQQPKTPAVDKNALSARGSGDSKATPKDRSPPPQQETPASPAHNSSAGSSPPPRSRSPRSAGADDSAAMDDAPPGEPLQDNADFPSLPEPVVPQPRPRSRATTTVQARTTRAPSPRASRLRGCPRMSTRARAMA